MLSLVEAGALVPGRNRAPASLAADHCDDRSPAKSNACLFGARPRDCALTTPFSSRPPEIYGRTISLGSNRAKFNQREVAEFPPEDVETAALDLQTLKTIHRLAAEMNARRVVLATSETFREK